MILWLIGIITAILVVLIIWREASPEFRVRAEAPKFRFLEHLKTKNQSKNTIPKENRDESSHS